MKDDQFDKVFKCIGERFDGIEKRLEFVEEYTATRPDVDRSVNTVDDFIRQITDSQAKQVARDAQWVRLHERAQL